MNRRFQIFTPVVLLIALVAVAGCKKKQAPIAPTETAPTSSAPAPTAQITATPSQISAGDQVTLSWKTTDATSVSIDGIGDVPTTGVALLSIVLVTVVVVALCTWRVRKLRLAGASD